MNLVRARLVWVLLASLGALAGCAPKIGDKCSVSTDCSAQGDRLCDPTQPDGYCTIFNCEPNKCPSEAVCVAFNEASCSSPALAARFQRTFCMLACKSDSDCRSGYRCLDTTSDPARQVVDANPQSLTICAVPNPGPTAVSAPDPEVCGIPDAGPPPDAGADAAGEEGAVEASPDAVAPEAAPAEDASPDAAATDDAADSAD
jgi:hypothetical protein